MVRTEREGSVGAAGWRLTLLGVLALGLVAASLTGCCGTPCGPTTTASCDPCTPACDPCGSTPPCGPCGPGVDVKPGEAWCRVWVPPRYGTVAETVCVEPARCEKVWIPPRYGKRPKLVCLEGPSLREKTTPAVWTVKKEERVVCPEQEYWKRICCPQADLNPCEMQMDCWTKCVKPAVTCDVPCPVCIAPEQRCVQYKPAQYKVREENFVICHGKWQTVNHPARFEQRCKQVCCEPGHWEWRRNTDCEVPCAPPVPCAPRPMPAPCAPPPPPPAKLPALQVEMQDSAEGGEDAGQFAVGDLVRYDLRILSDEGSQALMRLSVTFTLPPELDFVSGSGNGVTVTGSGKAAASQPFDLQVGGTVSMHILCRVMGVPPSNLVQLTASVRDETGFELAVETESSTLKPAK